MKPKIFSLVLVCLLSIGCAPADRPFWYPVKLKEASCGSYSGEVYLMTNSIGWRSWPYYIDKDSKSEIEIGSGCVLITIRDLPEHKRNIQDHLTNEQKEYLVEGFQ